MSSADAMAHTMEWAEGRRSHINEMIAVEGDGDRNVTLALTAFADAQEAVKWSALAVALRGTP